MRIQSPEPIKKTLALSEYTVGWISALAEEHAAAKAMLDDLHELPKDGKEIPTTDGNSYTVGAIGKHYVVLACLPRGSMGSIVAANCASQLVSAFPTVKVVLMVGIGGGIPDNVRLGDVVIGAPVGTYSGVVQWDFGKAGKDRFERTGSQNKPPAALLTAVQDMESNVLLGESNAYQHLKEVIRRRPKLASRFSRPQPRVLGQALQSTETATVEDIHIHYGLIASGNQVVKDAKERKRIETELDAGKNFLCIEMEAAGLDGFPCLVIRGISDYADENKNDDWKQYAAAVAAAVAKEVLEHLRPSRVLGEGSIQKYMAHMGKR